MTDNGTSSGDDREKKSREFRDVRCSFCGQRYTKEAARFSGRVASLPRKRYKFGGLIDQVWELFLHADCIKSLQSMSFRKCTSPGRSRLFGERTEEGVVSEDATLDRFVRENRDF